MNYIRFVMQRPIPHTYILYPQKTDISKLSDISVTFKSY